MSSLQDRAAAYVSPETLQNIEQTTNSCLSSLRKKRERFLEQSAVAHQRFCEQSTVTKQRLAEQTAIAKQRLVEQSATAKQRLAEQSVVARQRFAEQSVIAKQTYVETKAYAQILAQSKEERVKALKHLHGRLLHEKNMIMKGKRGFLVPAIIVLVLWNCFGFATHRVNHGPDPLAMITEGSSRRMTSAIDISQTVVDVISVGSLLKQDFHQAQLRTFAKHPAIRDFYPITEKNDTDATCFTDLTSDQLDSIVDFCANTKHQSYISTTLRKNLFHPKKHSGWMCSQKRKLDALFLVLEKFKRNEASIPDYLFIIEDDTYINMDTLLVDLQKHYPPDQPFAVAGCNRDFLKSSGITFPEGGFGSFFTRRAIERFLQPVYCDGRDQHSHIGCWRLNINALGEKSYYTEGMSVHELMHAFTSAHKFTQVEKWSKSGYCMHADHALAFFTNFYHIPVPEGVIKPKEQANDKIRRKYSFTGLQDREERSECANEREECKAATSRICHDIDPAQMDHLFAEQHPQKGAATPRHLR